MNREIKFEVIITGNHKELICKFTEYLVDGEGWKHTYYAPMVTNGVFDFQELGDGWMGEIIRRQYTGLTDKNGKEIYENDIVKCHYFYEALGNNLGVYEAENEIIGLISIEDMGLWIECKSEYYSGYLLFFNLHEESFEVIGNVFETPELIQS